MHVWLGDPRDFKTVQSLSHFRFFEKSEKSTGYFQAFLFLKNFGVKILYMNLKNYLCKKTQESKCRISKLPLDRFHGILNK